MVTKVILDRVEKDRAILEIHGRAFKVILPSWLLPSGAKEGDVLTLYLKKTRKTKKITKARKKEARSLLDKILRKNN